MSALTTEETTAQECVKHVRPSVDLRRNADGYTLEVEMPGVGKEGVSITFEEGKLVLTGKRREQEAAGKVVHRESGNHDYRRVFNIDPAIDAARISATVEQGVLTVSLPKSEASKPRKIAVG